MEMMNINHIDSGKDVELWGSGLPQSICLEVDLPARDEECSAPNLHLDVL